MPNLFELSLARAREFEKEKKAEISLEPQSNIVIEEAGENRIEIDKPVDSTKSTDFAELTELTDSAKLTEDVVVEQLPIENTEVPEQKVVSKKKVKKEK